MFLSIKEAAERTGVSQAMLYQWCKEKRLSHFRFGGMGRRGKILIDPADLEAFLASCKVTPSACLPEGLRHIRQLS